MYVPYEIKMTLRNSHPSLGGPNGPRKALFVYGCVDVLPYKRPDRPHAHLFLFIFILFAQIAYMYMNDICNYVYIFVCMDIDCKSYMMNAALK